MLVVEGRPIVGGAGLALMLVKLFRYFAVIGLSKIVHKMAYIAVRDS